MENKQTSTFFSVRLVVLELCPVMILALEAYRTKARALKLDELIDHLIILTS